MWLGLTVALPTTLHLFCLTGERMGGAKDELARMLAEDELRDVKLLVYANKQDLPNAMPANEVSRKTSRKTKHILHVLDIPPLAPLRLWGPWNKVSSSSSTSSSSVALARPPARAASFLAVSACRCRRNDECAQAGVGGAVPGSSRFAAIPVSPTDRWPS